MAVALDSFFQKLKTRDFIVPAVKAVSCYLGPNEMRPAPIGDYRVTTTGALKSGRPFFEAGRKRRPQKEPRPEVASRGSVTVVTLRGWEAKGHDGDM